MTIAEGMRIEGDGERVPQLTRGCAERQKNMFMLCVIEVCYCYRAEPGIPGFSNE